MSIQHEIVAPKNKPLPKNLQDNPLAQPSLSLIIGPTGSGKSVVVANMLMALQKLHDFDTALFVTGNNRDSLLESIEMPIATTPQELSEYITQLKQAKEGTKHIIVLDDIQGASDFNIFSNRSEFTQFILSHRHFGADPKKPHQYGTWVISTAQTFKNSYSTTFKDQIKNMFIFYPRSPNVLKQLHEVAQDPTVFSRAMAYVKSKGEHNFLFINKWNSKERYYLNFNQELKDLQ